MQLGPLDEVLRDLGIAKKRAICADVCDALIPFEHSGRVILDAVAALGEMLGTRILCAP